LAIIEDAIEDFEPQMRDTQLIDIRKSQTKASLILFRIPLSRIDFVIYIAGGFIH